MPKIDIKDGDILVATIGIEPGMTIGESMAMLQDAINGNAVGECNLGLSVVSDCAEAAWISLVSKTLSREELVTVVDALVQETEKMIQVHDPDARFFGTLSLLPEKPKFQPTHEMSYNPSQAIWFQEGTQVEVLEYRARTTYGERHGSQIHHEHLARDEAGHEAWVDASYFKLL